jgi:glutamate N-acetyltransferase / amino-acid N-acetyltransferase
MSCNILKRLSSTIAIKPTPSKVHHHQQIPDSAFPKGYVLTGIHSGIKKNPQISDLGIILSTSRKPTSAAACFTRNVFQAAPVIVSQQVLDWNKGRARALVVNSGCANAVTGGKGLEDAWAMAHATDELLEPAGGGLSETLVMSTGVIGQLLPISKILSGIDSQKPASSASSFGSGFDAWERAAKAFMTTDTFPKLRARTFKINGQEFRMAGMDKGAGMIHPDMGPPTMTSFQTQLHATLLGCILTDAPVSPKSLQNALTYAVERSFNSISVDGEMSTNDTIIVLANGAAADAGYPEIDQDKDAAAYEMFKDELTAFAVDLAKLVVRDGEGATKFVTVSVEVRMSDFLPLSKANRVVAGRSNIPRCT